ncbi:hypothetical protein LB506_009787 [Fusarium annulatum]|nr:hypothetical protein LB506_009787 [Fusarium annulatum]
MYHYPPPLPPCPEDPEMKAACLQAIMRHDLMDHCRRPSFNIYNLQKTRQKDRRSDCADCPRRTLKNSSSTDWLQATYVCMCCAHGTPILRKASQPCPAWS